MFCRALKKQRRDKKLSPCELLKCQGYFEMIGSFAVGNWFFASVVYLRSLFFEEGPGTGEMIRNVILRDVFDAWLICCWSDIIPKDRFLELSEVALYSSNWNVLFWKLSAKMRSNRFFWPLQASEQWPGHPWLAVFWPESTTMVCPCIHAQLWRWATVLRSEACSQDHDFLTKTTGYSQDHTTAKFHFLTQIWIETYKWR